MVIHRLHEHGPTAWLKYPSNLGIGFFQIQVVQGAVSDNEIEAAIVERCAVCVSYHEFRRRTIHSHFRSGGASPFNELGGNVDANHARTKACEMLTEFAVSTAIIEHSGSTHLRRFPDGCPQTPSSAFLVKSLCKPVQQAMR